MMECPSCPRKVAAVKARVEELVQNSVADIRLGFVGQVGWQSRRSSSGPCREP